MKILLLRALRNFRNRENIVPQPVMEVKCLKKGSWMIQAHHVVVSSGFLMRHESSQNMMKRVNVPLRLNSQELIATWVSFKSVTRGEHSVPEFTDPKFGKIQLVPILFELSDIIHRIKLFRGIA